MGRGKIRGRCKGRQECGELEKERGTKVNSRRTEFSSFWRVVDYKKSGISEDFLDCIFRIQFCPRCD